MTERGEQKDRGVFIAKVRSNRRIGPRFYKLVVEFTGEGASAFGNCRPGQFAQFDLRGAGLPDAEAVPEDLVDSAGRNILLRRPFSFSDISGKPERVFAEVLYCAVGPASLRMSALSAGDSLSVLGPLGRGFWVDGEKKLALLVAGGMGAGPLEHLAKVLTEEHPQMQVVAFAGAATVRQLPFERRLDELAEGLGFSIAEFAKYGIESYVATDDGSAGFHGLVTDCVRQHIESHNINARETTIYACGPEAMLAKTAELAAGCGIDCQVSIERRMACGIGVCQSCVVRCKGGDGNETVQKLCCEDGPVFDAREVIFEV